MEHELVSSEEARRRIAAGATDPIRVDGLLDLTGLDAPTLPLGISCFDLDASGSSLKELSPDLVVNNRLILDQCLFLENLPDGLALGSLRAREAMSLHGLPEGFSTWFLDLEGSTRFHAWPEAATIHRGQVSLRGCLGVQSLPPWFDTLATLDLSDCFDLRRVPDGFQVSQWIDVGGTRIEHLPSSLEAALIKWRGVTVNRRIAFEPETITARAVIKEDNAELRRVMMERMGYLRFAEEAGAKVLDKDTDPGGERQLLKIELNEDEPLVGLNCSCPSTGQNYLLRVPPATKTCHQAAAWIAGFDDADMYHPVIET